MYLFLKTNLAQMSISYTGMIRWNYHIKLIDTYDRISKTITKTEH